MVLPYMVKPRLGAHRGLVALGVGGLFFKFDNQIAFIGIHDAKAAGFFPRHVHDGDGGIGFGFTMELII